MGSKVWGHISKAWKVMVKGVYQLLPYTRMELLHSNTWWSDGVDLLNKGFTYAKGLNLYHKGIQCVNDIWDGGQQNFLTWRQMHERFNLTPIEVGDWEELTNKIFGHWCHLLDVDLDTTHPGQWIGFYVNDEEELTFVFRSATDFAPQCMQWHNLTLPLLVQCFVVGTHIMVP